MKPFHWTKLPPNECRQALWDTTKTLYRAEAWRLVSDGGAELELHFGAKAKRRGVKARSSSEGGEAGAGGRDKAAATNLLDLRRAQNTSIMLSKFRCSLARLRQAIVQVDASLLSPDDVQMLKLYVPTDEEANRLRGYQGPPAALGIAERFFLEILDVPRYQACVRVGLLRTDDRPCAHP